MTTKIFNIRVKCEVQICYKICLMAPQTFLIEGSHIWHNGCLSLTIQVAYCQYDHGNKGQGQIY